MISDIENFNIEEFTRSLDNLRIHGTGRAYYMREWRKNPAAACYKFLQRLAHQSHPIVSGMIKLKLNEANESLAEPPPPPPFTFNRCLQLYPRWGDCMLEWQEAVDEGRAVMAD